MSVCYCGLKGFVFMQVLLYVKVTVNCLLQKTRSPNGHISSDT